jgi:hypothetical protein
MDQLPGDELLPPQTPAKRLDTEQQAKRIDI